MERLQKIISAAGVASRRKAEELITSGLVQVNGQTITELGAKADASKDHIRVNGKLIKFSGHHVYILLNKPKGYVTTLSDPEGRPTIVDLLKGVKQRVYPVGRLDYASEGLLLLTNDGELANALTKAASHVPKTYLVKVSGQPSDAAIEQLRAGIELPDRKGIHSRTAPAGIQLVHKSENPWYEVTLIEGRNRQIRAMFELAGHHVEKLKRVRYGPFTLDVHPGKHRNLLPEEVDQLRSAIQRGTGATAEASVRPIERVESHIEAELREEERSPAKFQPATKNATADGDRETAKPKRAPKPLGTFAAKPRALRSAGARPERPGVRGGGASRGDDFRKKRPYPAKFGRESGPFQKRSGPERPDTRQTGTGEDRPRPARAASAGARPDWKKSAGPRGAGGGAPRPGAPKKWDARPSLSTRPRTFESRSPRPDWKKSAGPRSSAPRSFGSSSSGARPGGASTGASAGAPKRWEPRPSSPGGAPRSFDKSSARPNRPTGTGERPEWKRPSASGSGARSGAPRSDKPRSASPRTSPSRKWTQGAPAATGRPRTFDKKPDGFRARPADSRGGPRSGPGKPRTDDRGEGRSERPNARPSADRPRSDRPSGDRPSGDRSRSDRPAAGRSKTDSPGGDRKPFWQGADKRRPRKPKAEGDSDSRPGKNRR